ncbi:unnamed protein product, partial [Brassica oleracea var. botrytis]
MCKTLFSVFNRLCKLYDLCLCVRLYVIFYECSMNA